MDFHEVRDHFDTVCTYLVGRDALVNAVGDVTLDAPADDTETGGAVLDRAGQVRYRSADDAYQTLLNGVGEAYADRKHYDDRSGARCLPNERTEASL